MSLIVFDAPASPLAAALIIHEFIGDLFCDGAKSKEVLAADFKVKWRSGFEWRLRTEEPRFYLHIKVKLKVAIDQ